MSHVAIGLTGHGTHFENTNLHNEKLKPKAAEPSPSDVYNNGSDALAKPESL